VRGVEDDLCRCEAELQQQKAYIVTLENQRKMLQKHLSMTKALTAPIRQVSPEILGWIFSFFADLNDISRYRISIPGLTLASVCFHWCEVA
ncbi:hypothetical protein C8J56DRAFT_750210, partial [Mycena floridula]